MTHNVLVVDDELSILKSLERLLKRSGYQVLTAASGADALQLLQLEHCPVIITDFLPILSLNQPKNTKNGVPKISAIPNKVSTCVDSIF